jgi:predicted nuclease of predicted toxin-antitoxin system
MDDRAELHVSVRLYLDEHVWRNLAALLREQGFDALHVYEAQRGELSDEEQWEFAAQQGRALLTFDKNGGRFVSLAAEWFMASRPFAGLIISNQIERGELLRRVVRLLKTVSTEEMKNTVRFLSDFK